MPTASHGMCGCIESVAVVACVLLNVHLYWSACSCSLAVEGHFMRLCFCYLLVSQ